MSSTIVMMNKKGIAFATDSAYIKNSHKENLKTAPTANKIYNLCKHPDSPISIVLCDNRDFGGIPIEILILDFRKKFPGPWASLEECQQHFFDYLKTNPIKDKDYPNFFATDIYTKSLTSILHDYKKGNIKDIEEWLAKAEEQRKSSPKWENLAEPLVTSQKADHLFKILNQILSGSRIQKFDNYKEQLHRILLTDISIKREYTPDESFDIGLSFVLCGFGSNEFYPSLMHTYLVGFHQDKIISFEVYRDSISYQNPSIIYPAGEGKDIIESLIFGKSDTDLHDQHQMLSKIKDQISECATQIFNDEKDSTKTTALQFTIEETLGSEILFLEEDYKRNQLQTLKAIVSYPIVELARTAKMLIDVASFRQKLDEKIESIGGPVDVGTISKEHGFQWYARKLYFDPSINPQLSM